MKRRRFGRTQSTRVGFVAATVGGKIELFRFKLVQINVQVDVDDACLFPEPDGECDAGVGERDGGIVVGTDAAAQAVGGRGTALPFRLRLGLHLGIRLAWIKKADKIGNVNERSYRE